MNHDLESQLTSGATGHDLSVWTKDQTRLIRKVLWDYKERRVEGRGNLSWADIQDVIKDLTGVDMGAKDTLRQFAKGERKAPVAERRHAIVLYLMHPDVNELRLDEFLEPTSPYHAPKRLLEYLGTERDAEDIESPLPSLSGRYYNHSTHSTEYSSTMLELTQFGEDEILSVCEESEITDRLPQPTHLSRDQHVKSRKEYTGWCILTPEDNVLFFMKEKRYGENHYYHLIADINIWTRDPPRRLVLLRSDYPPVINTDNTDLADTTTAAMQALSSDVITFSRLVDE